MPNYDPLDDFFLFYPNTHGVLLYYYPTVYIQSNCLFLLCHGSLNYCPSNSFGYCLGLYHGLVSSFAVLNSQTLISMRHDDVRTVCLRQETLCYNGSNEAWFGNFKLQKLRVCVFLLFFFVGPPALSPTPFFSCLSFFCCCRHFLLLSFLNILVQTYFTTLDLQYGEITVLVI